ASERPRDSTRPHPPEEPHLPSGGELGRCRDPTAGCERGSSPGPRAHRGRGILAAAERWACPVPTDWVVPLLPAPSRVRGVGRGLGPIPRVRAATPPHRRWSLLPPRPERERGSTARRN